MESGSRSLQSSSAGDDDYDSHHRFPHAPPPLFFNNTTTPQQQLPCHLHNIQTPFLFDFPFTNSNPTWLRSTPNPLHPQPAATKKRTRASRRAPTTILTTDTTNFRAMVQEFTGIPSPPFAATASPSSRRFDLFGSVTTSRPKVQLLSSFNSNNNNDNNNVSTEDQNASHLQSVSEIRYDSPHIPLLTALQNDACFSTNCKL